MPEKIVTLAAFPKSGVTYLSSLLYFSFFSHYDAVDQIEKSFIVDIHIGSTAKVASYNGLSFIKSHFFFDISNRVCANTSFVIYLIRDPIDIMFSTYDFKKLLNSEDEEDFQTFTNRWIETGGAAFDIAGPWVEHVSSWLKQRRIPLLLVRYKDLVDHPAVQMGRICRFLSIAPAPQAIENAVANSTMNAMRTREEAEFATKKAGVFYNPSIDAGFAKGGRFVNKGHKDMQAQLTPIQQKAAEIKFGNLTALYLDKPPGESIKVGALQRILARFRL